MTSAKIRALASPQQALCMGEMPVYLFGAYIYILLTDGNAHRICVASQLLLYLYCSIGFKCRDYSRKNALRMEKFADNVDRWQVFLRFTFGMTMKINNVQFSLSPWIKDLKYHINRGKGHLPRYAWNRFKWHHFPRLGLVSLVPEHVDIELSSACDMRCPMCYTTTDAFKEEVPRKLMEPELFKKIINECAAGGTYSIRLSFRGEPFLNRHIVELTHYAKQKGIKEVATLTNGLRLHPEQFEQMMDAGLDWLTISFDGMGETYEKIRKPAKFDEAVEKIRQYAAIKKSRGASKPVVKIQTVWPAIADDPQAFYDLFEPIADQVFANPLVDYLNNDSNISFQEDFTCPTLWQRLVIGAAGEVVLCINDEFGRHIIGNVHEESVAEIWRGEAMETARRTHREHRGVQEIGICRECHLPRKTEAELIQIEDRSVQVDNYKGRTQVIGQ